MNLKKSLFNRAIYKSTIKRYFFISAIYFLVTEIIIDYFYLSTTNIFIGNEIFTTNLELAINLTDIFNFISVYHIGATFFLAVVLAIVFFHYIQNEKALTMIHALPVSRKSLYITNYAVFLTLFTIPLFIHFMLISVHLALIGFPLGMVLAHTIPQFLLTFIAALGIFSFSVFIGMLVGNFVLQAALIGVFFAAPVVIVKLINVILSMFVRGYPNVIDDVTLDIKITPYYYFGDTMFLSKGNYTSIMFTLLTIILCGIGAYYIYKKRHLERCHDFIVFDKAKTIITFIITLIVSLIFATLLGSIGSMFNVTAFGSVQFYIGIFFGAFLGYVIMKMISMKSVNFFKFAIRGVIYGLVGCLILLLIDFDIFGYEKYIPKKEDVKYAYYMNTTYLDMENIIEEELEDWAFRSYNSLIRVEGEDLDKFFEMHEGAINYKGKNELFASSDDYMRYNSGTIYYVLDDGSTVNRVYNNGILTELSDELYSSKSNSQFRADVFEKIIKGVETGELNITMGESYGDMYPINENNAISLLNEYKKDLQKFTKKENEDFDNIIGEISIRKGESYYLSLPISKNYINTYQWLEERQYYNITKSNKMPIEVGLSRYDEDGELIDSILVEDIDLIEKLKSFGDEKIPPNTEYYEVFFLYNDATSVTKRITSEYMDLSEYFDK